MVRFSVLLFDFLIGLTAMTLMALVCLLAVFTVYATFPYSLIAFAALFLAPIFTELGRDLRHGFVNRR